MSLSLLFFIWNRIKKPFYAVKLIKNVLSDYIFIQILVKIRLLFTIEQIEALMFEINPVLHKVKELSERAELLRGYL